MASRSTEWKMKHTRGEAMLTLENIDQNEPSLTYEELRRKHGDLIMWSKRILKDDDTQKLLIKIQQQALQQSIHRIVLQNGNPISQEEATYRYPGLEKISREIYAKENGLSPWRQAIEEAGYVYPCQNYKNWSMKSVLDQLDQVGNEPEDFHGRRLRNNPETRKLEWACVRLFGGIGKAVILNGVDYMANSSRVTRKKHSFTEQDLINLMENNSLSYEDKIRCVFNALSLQYYPWHEMQSDAMRQIDTDTNGLVRTCGSSDFFDGYLEVRLDQVKDEPRNVFSTSLQLNEVQNRFYRTDFFFGGDFAGYEATDFHEKLAATLSKIEGFNGNSPNL